MRKLWVLVPLLALLAGAVALMLYAWARVEGPPMPATGYVAMSLGIVFSVVVGCGLMALAFYSSRHGYDEGIGRFGQDDDTSRPR
jgi:hypothetical protein